MDVDPMTPGFENGRPRQASAPPVPARRVDLLGLNLDSVTVSQAVGQIHEWVDQKPTGIKLIFTPNLQHVTSQRSDRLLQQALATADLLLADGQPLVWASMVFGSRLPERVAGSDVIPTLLAIPDRKLRVFLLGGRPSVAAQAARNIGDQWPHIDIVGILTPERGFERCPEDNARICAAVSEAQPDLLLTFLGCPNQEKWLVQHRSQLDASVAIGAGATVDFLSGSRQRAPRWMRRSGLEWIHRMSREPLRLAPRYLRIGLTMPAVLVDQLRQPGIGARSGDLR